MTTRPEGEQVVQRARCQSVRFASWFGQNVTTHKLPDDAMVTVSLKAIGETTGDCSAEQMEVVADLARRVDHDEIRVSHEQNLVLPHVAQADLPAVYAKPAATGLATANINLISDIIACPSLDYCALANARFVSVAQNVGRRFASLQRQREVGYFKLKTSG